MLSQFPSELLVHIVDTLDIPTLSTYRCYDQPTDQIVNLPTCPLKTLSSTCRSLRQLIAPRLFRNLCLKLQCRDASEQLWVTQAKAFVEYVSSQGESMDFESLTLVVSGTEDGLRDACADQVWFDLIYFRNVLFGTLDWQRITIVAPPCVLGSLFGIFLPVTDGSDFFMPYHLISLERAQAGRHHQKPLLHPPQSCDSGLIFHRPWTACFINEGSFRRLYGTYPYPERRQPPSLVSALFQPALHFPPPACPIPRQGHCAKFITTLTYVAELPILAHALPCFYRGLKVEAFRFQTTFGNPDNVPAGPPPSPQLRDPWQGAWLDVATVSQERLRIYKAILYSLKILVMNAVSERASKRPASSQPTSSRSSNHAGPPDRKDMLRISCGDAVLLDHNWSQQVEELLSCRLEWACPSKASGSAALVQEEHTPPQPVYWVDEKKPPELVVDWDSLETV